MEEALGAEGVPRLVSLHTSPQLPHIYNPPTSAPRMLIHVRYFATPWTIVCQVPLSMEFSRQGTGVDCYFLLWGFCYLVWGNLLQQLQDAHTDKNSSIWCEEQDRQWRLVGDASPKAVWTHHPLGDFTLNSQQQGWPENSVSLFLPLARRTG